jgi:uncharacterized protein (TIRG00374 family)
LSNSSHHRLVRIACWALGVAAVIGVFRSTGAEPVRIAASALGGYGWTVFLVYAAVNFWDVWGWRVVFLGAAGARVKFFDLYLIRLAGEAVNGVTPFVDIGGEFLKVALAAKRFGLEKKAVIPTVVIERVALLASEVAFWFAGLAAALLLVPEVRHARAAWIAAAAVSVPVVFALYWITRKGFFAAFYVNVVKRWVKAEEALTRDLEGKIQDVDARISQFCTQEPGRNVVTFVLHFVGWVAGGIETWAMFHICGVPLSVGEGIMIEALFQLLKTASFFIPGNLGAQEAGLAYFGGWFGYAGPVGVAVSLLKRLRQLAWTLAGFAIWSWMAHRTHATELYPTHHSKRPHV